MMVDQQNMRVLILEKEKDVVEAIKRNLENGPYVLHIHSSFKEAVSLLTSEHIAIAIIGNAVETNSPFEGLLEIVKASPLTSTILLSDLSEKEVHERSEGCGILGHVPRNVPPEDLEHLFNQYRKISGRL